MSSSRVNVASLPQAPANIDLSAFTSWEKLPKDIKLKILDAIPNVFDDSMFFLDPPTNSEDMQFQLADRISKNKEIIQQLLETIVYCIQSINNAFIHKIMTKDYCLKSGSERCFFTFVKVIHGTYHLEVVFEYKDKKIIPTRVHLNSNPISVTFQPEATELHVSISNAVRLDESHIIRCKKICYIALGIYDLMQEIDYKEHAMGVLNKNKIINYFKHFKMMTSKTPARSHSVARRKISIISYDLDQYENNLKKIMHTTDLNTLFQLLRKEIVPSPTRKTGTEAVTGGKKATKRKTVRTAK